MQFSTFSFLLFCLPGALLLSLLPRLCRNASNRLRWQNSLLLFLNLLFYAWGDLRHLPLLLCSLLLLYGCGRWLAGAHGGRRRILLLGVTATLLPLVAYKYLLPLGIGGLQKLAGAGLPLGISFYTFSGLAYLADVYSNPKRCEKSLLLFGTYLTLFPVMTAGPITTLSEVREDLCRLREPDTAELAAGLRRFIAGLAKKALLADPAGALFTALLSGGVSGAAAGWSALLAFAFRIYYDFSGYTDMALGVGQMLGLQLPENFDYPYTAVSFTDFWRRWHMTLSGFFKRYVYIPLGGNRRGIFRTVCHLFAVWALTGLWHGGRWNFLLWGLYYFAGLCLEKFLLRRYLEKLPCALRRILTLAGVLLGWLLFALDGRAPALALSVLPAFLKALFSRPVSGLYDLFRHIPFFLIAALGATPLPKRLYRRAAEQVPLLSLLFPLVALVLSAAYLADAAFLPFLYAGF